MGIEPTGRPVKDEPTHFEDGGGHQSRAHFHDASNETPILHRANSAVILLWPVLPGEEGGG